MDFLGNIPQRMEVLFKTTKFHSFEIRELYLIYKYYMEFCVFKNHP